jgi:hypothetical protein
MDVLGAVLHLAYTWSCFDRVKVGGSGKVRGVPPLGSALELGSGKRRTGPPPVLGPGLQPGVHTRIVLYRIGAMIGAQKLEKEMQVAAMHMQAMDRIRS